MMHDSFCRLANKPGALGLDPCPECFGGEHDIFCPVMDSSVAVPYCSCARIEMIRQDEQNRVIGVLERLYQYLHDSNCITWAYDSECDCHVIKIIRGENNDAERRH